MTTREWIKNEIDTLPEESLYIVRECVLSQKRKNSSAKPQKIREEKDAAEIEEGYQILSQFRGTLKRDVDCKKERLEALDEKYGHIS